MTTPIIHTHPAHTNAREVLSTLYLDWFNNYGTVEHYAECNGITSHQAVTLIDLGRSIVRGEHPDV